MHNTLNRVQGVFGFFTTVVGFLAAFIAFTDFTSNRTVSGTVIPNNLQVVKGRPHYYSTKKEEYAVIRFSLDANLTSLFTWNTKQLFVYVTAEWPSPSPSAENATDSAVIWDTIITSPRADHLQNIGPVAMRKLKASAKGKALDPDRGLIKLKNQKPKYQITHPSGKMGEMKDVTLKLHYHVQPWVGPLTWDFNWEFGKWKSIAGGLSEKFSLPAVKKKDN